MINKFTPKQEKKILITTNLVVKNKKPKKDFLPKKIVSAPVLTSPPTIANKPTKNYSDILKNLSNDFKKETEQIEENQPLEIDESYYDQIYTLIKQSFVVPPHVLGPKGDNLIAQVKIFINSDGQLLKAKMKIASLDDHFNKAALDGINRVHNFGIPPVFLRESLLRDGVVVELCPNKCPKH